MAGLVILSKYVSSGAKIFKMKCRIHRLCVCFADGGINITLHVPERRLMTENELRGAGHFLI